MITRVSSGNQSTNALQVTNNGTEMSNLAVAQKPTEEDILRQDNSKRVLSDGENDDSEAYSAKKKS